MPRGDMNHVEDLVYRILTSQVVLSFYRHKSLILVGSGGHAKSLIKLLKVLVVAYTWSDWFASEVGNSVLGYSVIGTDENLVSLRQTCRQPFYRLN